MNILFRGASARTEGTLCQLKADFGHKSLSKEVKNNVQEVWNMLQVMVIIVSLIVPTYNLQFSLPLKYCSNICVCIL